MLRWLTVKPRTWSADSMHRYDWLSRSMRLTISRSGLGSWATLPLRFFWAAGVWERASGPLGNWRPKHAGSVAGAVPGAADGAEPAGTRAVEGGFSAKERTFGGLNTVVEEVFMVLAFGF